MSLTQADDNGYFGSYGGAHLPPHLVEPMAEVAAAYEEARQDPEFIAEYERLLNVYVGRPSPLYLAPRLTAELGGAKVYLKREDLNHTGAHKINHTLGEALLAKRMGKTKLIAEINLKYDVPVIFGLLTTNTLDQAIARSGGRHGNKGDEAAITALKMIELQSRHK